MLKKSVLAAILIGLSLASSAFGEMDQKKAEVLVGEYLNTLSHPKQVEMSFDDGGATMENLDAALYKTHVKENADKSEFISDEYFKTPSISGNKVPKGEYFVNDNVSESTELKIVGSKVEKDSCLVTVMIVNHEAKWRIKNAYKVVAEAGKYRIYPSKLNIDSEGSIKKYWIDAYHLHEELKY